MVKKYFWRIMVLVVSLTLLTKSTLAPASGDIYERARRYTRADEFDYVNWTLEALLIKNIQASVKAPEYMSIADQHRVVMEYLHLVQLINQTSAQIDQIYADPNIANPKQTSAGLAEQLRIQQGMEDSLKPIAEQIIQYQVSTVIAEMGLGAGGQPIPPVMYSVTSLPNALIISPRNVIREDADISLVPGMSAEQINQLENQVSTNLDVSALVVPVGGIGIYPTMVMSTTNLPWLLETVSHEWTHNYLTLRPLGIQYMASPEMRTINETTANISGKEIGAEVLRRYYPELAPKPEPTSSPTTQATPEPTPTPTPENPNAFNFNREMHKTRVQVDQMLKDGKIKEAEDYMEARRRFFWDHGYQIRKLNQAYFAFYGAYADSPSGGAQGTDPVGPAVQELRQRSQSLADFLNKISWISSWSDLQKMVAQK